MFVAFKSKLKDMLLSKALTCMNFSCINKSGYFIVETDTFGYIVVWTVYTSHTDHYIRQIGYTLNWFNHPVIVNPLTILRW